MLRVRAPDVRSDAREAGALVSRASRKGADAERAVAKALGVERTRHRGRFESAPDVAPVLLASGHTLTVESKARGSVPRWLVGAVEQAAKYLPSAIPVAVVSGAGARLAVLRLEDLAALVGLRAVTPQGVLPLEVKR